MSSAPSLTVFRPSSATGTMWGGGITLVCLAIGAGLIYKALQMDVRFEQLFPFVGGAFFLGLAAIYGYWTWGCNSLSYIVDRNALSIRWGGVRQIVPLSNIERLIPGSDGESPHIAGVNWPGHHVGLASAEELGEVLFYSGHRSPEEVLYVLTPDGTYGISVPDPVAFALAVQTNQSRGPMFEQRQAVHRWGVAAQTFWLDPQARLLGLVLIATFFAVLGYVLQIYPGLAQQVPLRFPSLGGIVRVSDKSELLDIPRSAGGFLAINLLLAILLHTWERMVAYVLLLSGMAIQVMLLVAAVVAVA
ncbi:MAG TPA: PH domain-containing protein [Dehalococcoidia bacterium]|nr:PH domain-containing protein [Dehalococcoidia bacterium]